MYLSTHSGLSAEYLDRSLLCIVYGSCVVTPTVLTSYGPNVHHFLTFHHFSLTPFFRILCHGAFLLTKSDAFEKSTEHLCMYSFVCVFYFPDYEDFFL